MTRSPASTLERTSTAAARTVLPAAFTGWGASLPGPPVTNDDLAAVLDTSDAWIASRTGIRSRHIADGGTTTAQLAASAGTRALDRAGRGVDDVDLLVVATTTPDRPCPATASDVAGLLGFGGMACDVSAACAGFVAALHLALPTVATGSSRIALVVGAERMSSLVDPTDRRTAVLFGDGAGALVVEHCPSDSTDSAEEAARRPGLVAAALGADPTLVRHLEVPVGGRWLEMDGPEVFRAATRALVDSGKAALAAAGVTADEVAWYVPHQANRRIIDAVVGRLGLVPERVVLTLDRHGNTSAASIPIALSEAADDGRVRPGDLVLVAGVGAGMTWGSQLLRWGGR